MSRAGKEFLRNEPKPRTTEYDEKANNPSSFVAKRQETGVRIQESEDRKSIKKTVQHLRFSTHPHRMACLAVLSALIFAASAHTPSLPSCAVAFALLFFC